MVTQVYFKDIQHYIKQELNNAEESIFIAVAWFTDHELFDLLCLKARLKVLVELIIIDDEINNNSGIDYNDLISYGSSVTKISNNQEGESIMHNKFCIIDHKIVINGSYNWTNKAKRNSETITIHNNSPDLVAQFKLEFYNIKEKYIITDFTSSSQIKVKIKRKENQKAGYLDYPINVFRPNKFNLLPTGKYIIKLSQKLSWSDGRTAYRFETSEIYRRELICAPETGVVEAGHFAGSEVVNNGTIAESFTCNVTATKSSFTFN